MLLGHLTRLFATHILARMTTNKRYRSCTGETPQGICMDDGADGRHRPHVAISFGHVFSLLVIALLLGGCAGLLQPRPTPEPLPIPSPTAPALTREATTAAGTPVDTRTREPASQFVPSGLPKPVPVLYKMFDWGTDYQNLHPEYGPIGSIQFFMWNSVNPASDVYNWDVIDSKLGLESDLNVTLLDGTEIPKPVVIQVFPYISSAPNWDASFYDATPRWVYDIIDSQNPGAPRPIVQGRKVGYTLTGCDTTAVVPMYDSSTWRQSYYKMVRAFGERYGDHPQVSAIVINTGLDGETQVVKDLHCPWNTYLDQQASGVRYHFGNFVKEAMAVYRGAFPRKPIFINNAPGGSGMRKMTSDHAATFDPPIGLKHSGMWVDLDSHQGYGDFYGSWDMIRAYSMTLPIWLESPFGLGGKEHRYWSFVAGLHYHPDAIDVHPEYLTQSDPEWFEFAVSHLGVSIHDTPSVWTVLRDAEYPLVSWGKGGVSGFMGDWAFWLYRLENAPQSATERVWRADMPAARDHVYSRQTRRTQESTNNFFMAFDIDDAYPYVNQKPVGVDGGNVRYTVDVTILNMGTDNFSLQYRSWDGGIVSQTVRKGASLGKVNDWVTVPFLVLDGYLNNNMPGGSDFRISSDRDGDEYIHKVSVSAGWGVPPPPTSTPLASATRRPTSTRRPTATLPPSSTPKPTPTGPTPTPLPASPTPTPASTPTLFPQAVRFDPIDDTYLDQWAPNVSWFDDRALSLRQGDIRAPLLRFDLSSVPRGAVVDRAVVSLGVMGRTNEGYLNVAAYKVYRPWSGSQSTWAEALEGTPWAVAGCNDPLRDRSSVSVADIWLTESNVWYHLDITPLVQDWADDPATNYGLILKSSGSTSVQYDFYSSDHPNVAMKPRLLVSWHEVTPTLVTPSITPTPVTPSATATETTYYTPTPTGTTGPTLTPTKSPIPSATAQPTPISVVLREGDGYSGMVDTYVDAWAENANFEESIKTVARQGSLRVPLMRFDLTSIPDFVSVKAATLHLYATGRTNPGVINVSLAKINRPWHPSQVTWNQATASEAWFQAGVRDIDSDRSAEVYASGVVDNERYWTHWDLTTLVQDWVSDPEHNYGLAVLADGNVSVQYDFTTSGWPSVDYRPYLEIRYIPVKPSPTPIATYTLTPSPSPAITPTPTNTLFPATAKREFQQGTDDYDGCVDTYVDQWNPRLNGATREKLIVRQGHVRSALLRFDLSSLRDSSGVNKALLHVYVQSRSGPHSLPVQIYGVTRSWKVDEVTHQRATKKEPWAQEGVGEPGVDLGAQPIASLTLNAERAWVTFDVTQLVQEWVSFPERNLGLVIKGDGGVAVQYEFASSEWSVDPSLRPRLFVDWKPLPPTPTMTGTPPTATPTRTATPTPTNTPTATPTRQRVSLAYQQGLAGYEGVSDTYLDAWNQTATMGNVATFSVRQNGIRAGLVRFGLDDVPGNAIVIEARLELWAAYSSNPGRINLRAYNMGREWSESTASWIEAESGRPWSAPGADAPGEDRGGELAGTVGHAGAQRWASIDVTKAARQWIENPERNYGVMLKGEGGVSVEYQFASSQFQQSRLRPKLLLVYELEPDVKAIEGGRETEFLQVLGIATALLVLFYLLSRRGRSRGSRERDRSIVD